MTRQLNWPIILLLMIKDWQLFQKQLAAYLLAGIVALGFLGMAKPWAFYIGSLLLIIILVAIACFAISTSLLNERKEQTLAFVMSLPVSPLDFTVAKLAGNLLTFSVPFVVMALFTAIIVFSTPLPDGLVVLAALIFGHVLVAYCIALMVAMQVESEGWNMFGKVGSMVLINPFGCSPSPSRRHNWRAPGWSSPECCWSAEASLAGRGGVSSSARLCACLRSRPRAVGNK